MSDNWKDELKKTKTIASLGSLSLNSKTMTLVSGQSLAGKTASCLYFVDSAIKKSYGVLYIDTDQKSIMRRPEPNLFKFLYNKNKEKYEKFFNYERVNNLDSCIKLMDKYKPKLLVIDSIYTPFEHLPSPNMRGKKIKEFLRELRNYIWENKVAVILTTKTGRVNNIQVPLGGEGLKYSSDVKIMIDFPEKYNKDNKMNELRLFVVDRERTHAFSIENGGRIVVK